MAANNEQVKPDNAMPEMLSEFLDGFEVTVTDSAPQTREAPEMVVALAQWSYDNAKQATLSFRGGKEYFGKTGESAAKLFEADAKNAGKATTPPTTVRVTRNGIVVTVRAVNRIGRKGKENGDAAK